MTTVSVATGHMVLTRCTFPLEMYTNGYGVLTWGRCLVGFLSIAKS